MYGLRKIVQNSRQSKKDCKNWETRQYFTVPKEHKYDIKVSQSFLTKLIAREKFYHFIIGTYNFACSIITKEELNLIKNCNLDNSGTRVETME